MRGGDSIVHDNNSLITLLIVAMFICHCLIAYSKGGFAMYYYAYLNASNIVVGTYGFPSQVTIPSYIYIGTVDDKTVIGKRYNPQTGEFEEVTAFYYAQLGEKDICVGVMELPSEVVDPNLIRVDSLDQSLVGKWYNRDTGVFTEPPIHILAVISSSVVNYKDQDRWLDEVIDGKAEKGEAYTKAQADAKFAEKGQGGTGADGKSAYDIAVENGYVGTVAQWLHSLQGEAGEVGPQGEIGPQGIQGVQGAQGIQGLKGDRGADGRSCYEIAVAHGFPGTEEEFVASMKGVKGDKGEQGERGPIGPEGPQGPMGLQGAKGDTGAVGPTGMNGAVGPTGPQGPRGYEGAQGPRGYAGATGATGPQGPAGIDSNGNLNSSTNVLRIGGQQMLFNSGAATTLATNNQPTHIAGSSVYSRVAIQVSSDASDKENIAPVDVEDMADYIKKIQIINYNYKGEDKHRIGVTAQQLMQCDPDTSCCFVDKDETGKCKISFSELVFPLIAAVQQLQERVKRLEHH